MSTALATAVAAPFQIVASDMDGTILTTQHQLSERTKHVLYLLATEKGVSFVFATGRHHLSVRSARDSLVSYFAQQATPGSDVPQGFYLISSNGARVHAPSGALAIAHDIDADVVRALYEQYGLPHTHKTYAGPSPSPPSSPVSPAITGGDAGVGGSEQDEFPADTISLSAYTTSEWFMTSSLRTMEQMDEKFGVRPTVVPFDRHDERNAGKSVFDWFPVEGVGKLCFCSANRDLLERCEHQIVAQFGHRVSVAFSSNFSLDVMRGGVSKASALREVCERLGVTVQEAVAFGDSMNDAEMLQLVGKGYLMQNAQERLKRTLPHCEVIGHHEANGVAEKLAELYGLSVE